MPEQKFENNILLIEDDSSISRLICVPAVIGTVELCLRVSEDEFNNMGILRVDVRSDYEKEIELYIDRKKRLCL